MVSKNGGKVSGILKKGTKSPALDYEENFVGSSEMPGNIDENIGYPGNIGDSARANITPDSSAHRINQIPQLKKNINGLQLSNYPMIPKKTSPGSPGRSKSIKKKFTRVSYNGEVPSIGKKSTFKMAKSLEPEIPNSLDQNKQERNSLPK